MIKKSQVYMNSKIILCTGGARSGKSEFAERLANHLEKDINTTEAVVKAYVATGQAFDEEMKGRIKKHQMRRGDGWITFERHARLSECWDEILESSAQIILLDCLTMYVTNALLKESEINYNKGLDELTKSLLIDIESVVERTKKAGKVLIFVTNEVGQGIVPDNALSRHFRDIAGLVNQQVAHLADEVYLTTNGITIEIKSQEVRI